MVIVTAANTEATTMKKDEQGEIASSRYLCGRIYTGRYHTVIAHGYSNVVFRNKSFKAIGFPSNRFCCVCSAPQVAYINIGG